MFSGLSVLRLQLRTQNDRRAEPSLDTTLFQPEQLTEQATTAPDRQFPKISNYVIQAQVGWGGFGCVYRAARKSDRTLVAIKLLQPRGPLTDTVRTRFLREATLLCQLKHPHIVPFRELGIAGNQLYLVMEFIESTACSEIRRLLDPRDYQRFVFASIDACLDALVYLHDKGMVHRDLKPSNLLFQRRESGFHVFLADFGLAKDYLQAGHSGVTSDDEIAGTLGYLAPELLRGVKYYLPESDQYALAATCYDMLCGRPPIAMKSPASALTLIRNHNIPRIESLAPDVPPPLAEWLHRGLQTDSKKRFPTVREMRHALQNSLHCLN